MSDVGSMVGQRSLATHAMGATQLLAWGSSFYLPAVVAAPIAAETGWSIASVVGGLSLGLLVSGLCSPVVGTAIERCGGRPVLAASSVLLAAALGLLSFAETFPVFLASWLLMGLGMSSGLYDAGFATVGRLYGREARGMIATLTLWGGFASTVCWPFSAYLVETGGWRTACLVYAAIHLCVALPLHVFAIPPAPSRAPVPLEVTGQLEAAARRSQLITFLLLAAIVTFAATISSVLSVHLLTMFQLRGYELATAVALGAIIGPAQVGGRVLEMVVGRRVHPVWTMLFSVTLIFVGLLLLFLETPLPAIALIAYGAGNGIHTIARGALPLVIFAPERYAVLMGRLALPSLVVQAAAPSIGAMLIAQSANAMLAIVLAIASLNLLCAFVLVHRTGVYRGFPARF